MLGNSLNLSSAAQGWIGLSPIETLAQRACEPSLGEPPFNLHLELAEHINNKKANTPRDAAHAVLRLINSRNPHVALLALSLLDTLVKQCGYPFHLQIGTKEFLNEMVKRFPERPPPYPGPVMAKILELINEWKETICVESRWKEDLNNIKDMWRLLSYKGYRFKERRRDALAPSTSSLKSAEELENDDRTAQEAKLQELIRRGTPRDLALAQDLMKVLAGAVPESKPNYKAQALSELSKLESKVILMNELLDNVKVSAGEGVGEKFVKGDVYDQVSQVLVAARPKIQKWIADAQLNEEGGGEIDPESLDTFLQLNDQINNAMTRYEAYKKGDYTIGSVPAEYSSSSNSAPSQPGAPAKSDLIDLDFFGSSSTTQQPRTGPTNELADIFSATPGGQSPPMPQQQQQQPIDLAKLYSQSPSPTPSVGAYGGIALPTTPLPGQMFPNHPPGYVPNALGGQFGGFHPAATAIPNSTSSPALGGAVPAPLGVGFGWGVSAPATGLGYGMGAPTPSHSSLGSYTATGAGPSVGVTPMNVHAGGAGPGGLGGLGAVGVMQPTQQGNGVASQQPQQQGQQKKANDPFADLVDLL